MAVAGPERRRPAPLGGNLKCAGGRQALNGGEVGPLIGIWLEILTEEHGAPLAATLTLQGQRDEVAEPTGGHRVLVREEPVIRAHRDRLTRHRAGQQQRADRPRDTRRDSLGEENPDVRPVA